LWAEPIRKADGPAAGCDRGIVDKPPQTAGNGMNPNKRSGIRFLLRLIRDERGGEVLEYAIVAGLIAIAAISMITAVGGKVLARWASINSKM